MLAGCSSGTVAGDAGPVGKTAGEPVFSPCDDIPDDAVRAVGMDPATEERDIMDVHQPGWNICMWNNDTHFVTVFSSAYTLDDVRQNPDFEEFVPVDLAGREAFTFRDVSDRVRSRCDVATAVFGRAVMVSVSESGKTLTAEAPCDAALRVAQVFEPYLPE